MSNQHSEISQLSPQPVWQFFDKICSIPHPSKHEVALAQVHRRAGYSTKPTS